MAQNGIFQVIPLLQALNTIRVNQGASTIQMPQFQMPAVQAPDYSQSMGQERQAQDLLSQLVNMQAPAPVRPAFRTEDAIKGALGLLLGGGQNPGEFVAGYLQGKQGKAEGDTQRKMQDFNLQRQGMASQAEGLQRQAGLSRQMEGDRYDREYKTAYDTALRKFQGEQDRFGAAQRILSELAKVEKSSELIGIKEAARQLNIPLDPNAIAAAEANIKKSEELAAQQKSDVAFQKASDSYQREIDSVLRNFGTVGKDAYSQLMKRREAIAGKFKVSPDLLPSPFDGITLAKDRLALTGRDYAEKWANAKANLQLAEQRLQVARQNADTMRYAATALAYNRALDDYVKLVQPKNSETFSKIQRKAEDLRAGMKMMGDPAKLDFIARTLYDKMAQDLQSYEAQLEIMNEANTLTPVDPRAMMQGIQMPTGAGGMFMGGMPGSPNWNPVQGAPNQNTGRGLPNVFPDENFQFPDPRGGSGGGGTGKGSGGAGKGKGGGGGSPTQNKSAKAELDAFRKAGGKMRFK